MSRALLALFALVLVLSVAACKKDEGLKIQNFGPKSGPYTGGGTVNIQGTGLGKMGVKVYFGEKEAKVLGFIGESELKVEAPAGEIGKTVDILLQFDDAKSITLEKGYTYEDVQKDFGVDALVEGKAGPGTAPATPGGAMPPTPPPAPTPTPTPAPEGATPPAPAPAPTGATPPAPPAPAPQ